MEFEIHMTANDACRFCLLAKSKELWRCPSNRINTRTKHVAISKFLSDLAQLDWNPKETDWKSPTYSFLDCWMLSGLTAFSEKYAIIVPWAFRMSFRAEDKHIMTQTSKNTLLNLVFLDSLNNKTRTNKLCRRPPQYAPALCDLDLLTLKVESESRVTWPTSVPILVFLGLSVLDLGPMYATDRRQTDRIDRRQTNRC